MKANGHQSALEPVIEKVAARAHQAVDKAQRAADRAERAVGPATDLVSQSCSYVSANPVKSLGVAVLVGLLMGRILR